MVFSSELGKSCGWQKSICCANNFELKCCIDREAGRAAKPPKRIHKRLKLKLRPSLTNDKTHRGTEHSCQFDGNQFCASRMPIFCVFNEYRTLDDGSS
ncbi:hypothetical protein niasHT_012270 [Heterodera trifolii]|uniref:Uncharacterized protein n=1 Tax=Heterodera trifolii TaxID=157864 RepID=A0ABD2LFF0_9BILA